MGNNNMDMIREIIMLFKDIMNLIKLVIVVYVATASVFIVPCLFIKFVCEIMHVV